LGKRGKHGQKDRGTGGAKPSNVLSIHSGRVEGLHRMDPMGASWRQYPRSDASKALVERLKTTPETQRTGDDWWQLGEYQIVEGLSTGDESLVNNGSQALMHGAQLVPPHAGCMLDLGWLLCYKGLDQMAAFYLDQAVKVVPSSRDAWTLRGWACIGSGSREQAIESFRKAVSLPFATDGDRETLKSLENSEPLEGLRKGLVLRKFDDEVVRGKHGDPKEAARSGVVQLKQLLERKPNDIDIAYGLAYCYYILGRYDHAEPLLHRIIGETASNAEALTLLALISKKRDQDEQALSYYERAVNANSSHVLANTNLAAIYQDKGEFHRARPLLLRAIEAAQEDDPYLPIAMDLLANSFGSIEHDYQREADFHRQAIKLDPHRSLFHSNLIISLLSAGRAKDAQRAFQVAKDRRLTLPNQSLIEGLLRVYQDPTLHPYQYMQFVEQLAQPMGWPAMAPLVRRAWDRRSKMAPDELKDFHGQLGMMASHAGDRALALEIWRNGAGLPGGEEFSPNVAVELSHMGRHAEALAAAESMSMDTPRSWTILGNLRLEAGAYKLAMEAYRVALEKDEKFLLPISNAISTARQGLLAEELEPFIERLRADWQEFPTAVALLGEALVMQGKLASAAECFERALWDGENIRTPEELWKTEQSEDDLSLLGRPSLEHHYDAAACFLELGHLDRVLELVEQIRKWPKWMDGDWLILEAEVYLAKRDSGRAAKVISGMLDQPPPRLVAVRIALAQDDNVEADRLIAIGLADETASSFNHPMGKPDALFRVFAAQRALKIGDPEHSEELARDAVHRDPACALARVVLGEALSGRSFEQERLEIFEDGLRRAPGHSALVAALVESLVSAGEIDLASEHFERYRSLLVERGEEVVASRLGEFLAVDRLSRTQNRSTQDANTPKQWAWSEELSSPVREWLLAAQLALGRGEDLAAAYGLYVSKVAEFLLIEKVMSPFRESIVDAPELSSDRHRDVSQFMAGGRPPSIGGMARILEAASNSYRSSEDLLVTRFRDAISQGKFGDARLLRSREFVGQIVELGRTRNSAAHIGDQDLTAIKAASHCVIADGRPGILFTALRILHSS
jgi:tetratricopeptide (TPR) repeat protein